MDPRTRLTGIAATLAAIALTGCATLRVHSYLERGADFTHYRSYAWTSRDGLSTGDPRLDNNRFFSQRVEQAVNLHLAARGFEHAGAGAADLLVHIHPQVYDAGTLFVDLIDRRTNTLVWRGWAESSLDGVIDDQRSMEETIDKAVAQILARLPRNVAG